MNKLAIYGGKPVRSCLFPAHNFIGEEEKCAVCSVLDSGNLSGFLGCWDEMLFFGGPKVREFEEAWSEYIDATHTVSFNSATTALMAAVGAAGVGPGNEVIVTPYTMSATATAILAYNGLPVFADILPDTLCLDPADVSRRISPYTRAIITTALAGHPSEMDELMALAAEHGLVVIEDAAQAPGAVYKGRMVGSVAHMTVFSLNIHKHIHTGEGGMVTTADPALAERLQLIRNHGENVVEGKGVADISNTFGFNYRLTELQAAIAVEQLKKLPRLLEWRRHNATYLAERLTCFPGITVQPQREGCLHSYYVQPFFFDSSKVGVRRDNLIDAVAAELPESPERLGIPLVWSGFGRPLYFAPLYQKRIAYGSTGCPFACPYYRGTVDYSQGICPVCEKVEANTLCMNDFIRPPMNEADLDDVVRAIDKVFSHIGELNG